MLSLLTSIIVAGCTFQSDDTYYKLIPEPDISQFAISLDAFPQADTIPVYGPSELTFTIDADEAEVLSISAFLGDTQLAVQMDGSIGKVMPRLDQLQTGFSELSIELEVASTSGSLASELQLESLVLARKWMLQVDVDPPAVPTISLEVKDGLLNVMWQSHQKPTFEKYVLKRRSGGIDTEIELNDPADTIWVDEEYVGQYTEYTVSTFTPITSTTDTKTKFDNFNSTFDFHHQDSTAKVAWESTPFYGSFQSYVIHESPDNIVEITNADDSTYNLKLAEVMLGKVTNLKFGIRSKKSKKIYYLSQEYPLSIGTPVNISNVWSRITFNPVLNAYTQVDVNNLLIFDENLQITEVRAFDHNIKSVPYPGAYVYYYDSQNKNLYQEDILTGVVRSHSINYPENSAGCGNGLIYYLWGRKPPQMSWVYYGRILDLPANKYFYVKQFESNLQSVKISEDGRFFMAPGNEVFSVDSDTAHHLGTLAFDDRFVGFRIDKSSEILTSDNSGVDVYDVNTQEKIRTIPSPENGFNYTAYDPQTKNMLWTQYGSGIVYTVDIETRVKKKFEAFYEGFDRVYLLNGKLIVNEKYIQILP